MGASASAKADDGVICLLCFYLFPTLDSALVRLPLVRLQWQDHYLCFLSMLSDVLRL